MTVALTPHYRPPHIHSKVLHRGLQNPAWADRGRVRAMPPILTDVSHLPSLSTASPFLMSPGKQWGWGHSVSCSSGGEQDLLRRIPGHQHRAPCNSQPLT